MDQPTFVVTLKLDEESARRLNALRQRYFPPERNWIDAHVTLFHKVSSDGLAALEDALIEANPRGFEVALARPFSLGRGVAIRVESAELNSLRKRLADRLRAELSAQDRQGFRPHVTIQNKVTAAEAGESLLEIRGEWSPGVARALGLDLWEYLGGPWRLHKELPFGP